MHLYIRRCFIICICKILVKNFIIKDILKKKNDVHRISVRTIVYYTFCKTNCTYQTAQAGLCFHCRLVCAFVVRMQQRLRLIINDLVEDKNYLWVQNACFILEEYLDLVLREYSTEITIY